MPEKRETAIRDLKPGDMIELEEGVGRIRKITEASHMPPIFQDCLGRNGRSVYFDNVTGPDAGKPGVERVHLDTTVNVLI